MRPLCAISLVKNYFHHIMETNTVDQGQVNNISLFDNWEKEKPYGYSDDQLIDAYQKGLKKGKNEADRIVIRKLQQNLDKAIDEAEKMVTLLKEEYDILIKAMHLKIEDITSFTALIAVAEETYLSANMDKVYNMIGDYELKLEEDDFRMVFNFMGADKPLNKNALLSDGYNLRYKKESARQA